jgi:two-component system chemotaxis response regulator CheY
MAKTCLIVDDSRTIRRFARASLESLGLATREAADGRLALAKCREAMPEVILLDWNMPNMNGIEFLRELRAIEGGDRPIVLFCTTENEIERIVEAMESGANEYIMKPFDAEILAAKLMLNGVL